MVADRLFGGLMLFLVHNNTDKSNNNSVTVYGVVIARVHQVHLVNADWMVVSSDPQTKSAAVVHTRHHNLLLLLNLKTDTHFAVPQRMEYARQ